MKIDLNKDNADKISEVVMYSAEAIIEMDGHIFKVPYTFSSNYDDNSCSSIETFEVSCADSMDWPENYDIDIINPEEAEKIEKQLDELVEKEWMKEIGT